MKIQSRVKDYQLTQVVDIFKARPLLSELAAGGRLFFCVDASLKQHFESRLKALAADDFILFIEAHENNKAYLKLADYYQALIEAGFRRNDVLVTLGGGILQDINGFIASTLYRGIKWAFIPTTLLAQADSCIGSKTSINFGDSKNLIGTFYPPDLILVDTQLTKTLAAGDFFSGVGEIIKFHLLSNQTGYDRLKQFLADTPLRESPKLPDMIASTLAIKKSYFEQDEFDTGVRNLLNYGHCFGHALESASHFSIPHGIAVIIGMGFANRISLARGLMQENLFNELEDLLAPFYPSINFNQVNAQNIINYMKKDKKRVGADLTIILLKDIGNAIKTDDLTVADVQAIFDQWQAAYQEGGRR